MKCPKCSAEIADGSKFCVHCGNKIEAQSEQPVRFCTSCGEKLKPGIKFCTKCGAKQEEKTAPMQKSQQQASAQKKGQPVQAPVQNGQPVPAPVQKGQPVPAPMQQPMAAPVKKPKKKGGKGVIVGVILFLIILLAALLVGGYFYLTKVQGIDPMEKISELTHREKDSDDKDDEDDKDSKDDKDVSGSDGEAEKGDPALLDPADELYKKAKQEYYDSQYTESIDDAYSAIEMYLSVAEENHLEDDAADGIADTYEIYSSSLIAYGKIIEGQNIGTAGYETIQDKLNPARDLTQKIKDAGYEVDSEKFEEYSDGLVGRYKERYIKYINEITEREQWSRDEAWNYAEQAYSIQENGKVVLFDENDPEDPLTMRYAYCLAWITTKRCETGIADGTMTEKDAAESIRDVLPETDYNPLLIQTYITYAKSAGLDDVDKYQNAYNAIVDELKSEQQLSIVNTGINSGTSVDLRRFWYFNDLDGDDAYKVDIHNGTTKAVRSWIRSNIPQMLE